MHVALLAVWLAAAPARPAPALPLGVSQTLYRVSVPEGREPTPERVRLGEKLFRDTRLSSNGKVACATCHVPEKGFVDGRARSVGVTPQKPTQRNSPTILNAMFHATQF